MTTAEDILRNPKYQVLKNLTLICEAMEEYAKLSEHSTKEQEDKRELLNMVIALKYHYKECSNGRNTQNYSILKKAQEMVDKHSPLIKK